MMRDFLGLPVNRDFFGDIFDGFRELPDYMKMKTDIIEEDTNYKVILDVPGFTKDEVSIKVEDDILTICASKPHSNEEFEVKYLKRERVTTSIKRQFRFINIDKDNIKASFVDGVLTVTLPKVKEEKNVIDITIE